MQAILKIKRGARAKLTEWKQVVSMFLLANFSVL